MSITQPAGFRASGVTAGLKSSGASDLALVVNDGPRFNAACVFTIRGSRRCRLIRSAGATSVGLSHILRSSPSGQPPFSAHIACFG